MAVIKVYQEGNKVIVDNQTESYFYEVEADEIRVQPLPEDTTTYKIYSLNDPKYSQRWNEISTGAIGDFQDKNGNVYTAAQFEALYRNFKKKIDEDPYLLIGEGLVYGKTSSHLNGANKNVTTLPSVITSSSTYQTPTTVKFLEVISDNANDSAAGTGARKVRVTYLDASGDIKTEDVATNGLTAVAMVASCLRVLDYKVIESGSYADLATPSHLGTLKLQEVGTGVLWAQINVFKGLGLGKAQIGAGTVPKGYKGYIIGVTYSVTTSKLIDLMFFERKGILNISAPYDAMKIGSEFPGLSGTDQLEHFSIEEMDELTDFGFIGSTSTGTSEVAVEIEYILKKI